MHVKILSHF